MTSYDIFDMSMTRKLWYRTSSRPGAGAPGGGAVPQQLGQRQARTPWGKRHILGIFPHFPMIPHYF